MSVAISGDYGKKTMEAMVSVIEEITIKDLKFKKKNTMQGEKYPSVVNTIFNFGIFFFR